MVFLDLACIRNHMIELADLCYCFDLTMVDPNVVLASLPQAKRGHCAKHGESLGKALVGLIR